VNRFPRVLGARDLHPNESQNRRSLGTPGSESNRYALFGARDFKLKRLACVGARCRNPERSEGSERKNYLVPGIGIEPIRPFRGPGF
jgi:hypothetical protein